MPLVDASDLATHARSQGFGLCRFAIRDLEDLHAVDAAAIARACGVPVTDAADAEVLHEASIAAKTDTVTARLRRSGSGGTATEAAARCGRWESVEHCIVYNYAGSEDEARAMMARGQAELAAIPGVTEVFVGRAVDAAAKYRYVWLVRFASRAVIDSYRTHPTHVAFADSAFRPFAKDRLSIDFEGS